MKQTRTVYIGIVTYRSASLLPTCLSAIKKQTYSMIKIIIWDNAGELKIRSIAKRFGAIYVKSPSNLGYGKGHNGILQMISLGDNDYYLTLNPDAILDPTYVQESVNSAIRHNAGWITGRLYIEKRKKILYSVGHAIRKDGYAFTVGHGLVDLGQYNTSREVFGAPGATALYTGTMVHSLSTGKAFFDPNLFLYYEDIDIDWRGQTHGFSCWYEPGAVAEHPGGIPPKSLEGEILVNRFRTVMKHARPIDLVLYNIPIIFLHVLIRMIITPTIGISMASILLKDMPTILKQRSIGSHEPITHWFESARKEKTKQPQGIWQRAWAFKESLDYV